LGLSPKAVHIIPHLLLELSVNTETRSIQAATTTSAPFEKQGIKTNNWLAGRTCTGEKEREKNNRTKIHTAHQSR